MIIRGDCLIELTKLKKHSVDAIVTDPPYGLKFMGKHWDYDVPSVGIWKECMRVLKPGGHLLAFGGTRTYHRLVVNIEDAGFEIRDQIQWLYGSGFPKSHNLEGDWEGWGTALKPANEPICLARKPLRKGLTVAENVLVYETGALNIDESRIGQREKPRTTSKKRVSANAGYNQDYKNPRIFEGGSSPLPDGRWPANLILDETAAEMLDEQSGVSKSPGTYVRKADGMNANSYGKGMGESSGKESVNFGDSGGASRFFYVAKASKRERNAGLEGMTNGHPTVKPIKLMEYLIKLVTPPGGTVLDPFMGSGSTGVAAKKLGFNFTGIELQKEYAEIAEKRIGTTK